VGRGRSPWIPDRLQAAIRATAARHGLYDLDLFIGTGVLDKMPHVHEALDAGARALEAGVVRLYGVVVLRPRLVGAQVR
jgi:hypothetical protein